MRAERILPPGIVRVKSGAEKEQVPHFVRDDNHFDVVPTGAQRHPLMSSRQERSDIP
jgi:hypothetical protein